MPFDISTAKPVGSGGFDISTAIPIDEIDINRSKPKESNGFVDALKFAGGHAIAPFEAALSLGSGMAGAVAGQVAGNVNAFVNPGDPNWGKKAQKIKDATSEIMTYRPITEQGRNLSDAAGSLLSLPYQAMTYPTQKTGEFLEEKGYPNAGYIVKDAGQSAAMAAYPEAMKKGGSLARLAGDKAKTITQEAISPKPTPEHAVRQIFKGKEADVPKLKESLNSIDIRGVKSSKELQQRFEDSIPRLSKQVDAELAKDTKLYKTDEFSTKMQDAEGNVVTQNYVSEALNGLRTLYEKTQAHHIKGILCLLLLLIAVIVCVVFAVPSTHQSILNVMSLSKKTSSSNTSSSNTCDDCVSNEIQSWSNLFLILLLSRPSGGVLKPA